MPSIPFPWTRNDSKANVQNSTGFATSVTNLKAQFDALPPTTAALITFVLGSTTAVSSAYAYKRYFKRIRNSQWVTPKHLMRKRWIKGVVTSVGDADNFRLYHTPLGFNWPFKFRSIPTLAKELKDETLHIRMAGVDAPEAAHFGKPSQPYAAEALEWLRSQILGKKVYCQLLRTDQYGRIVALVYSSPRILPGFLFSGKNLSGEMLKAGWAITYEQAGAEYGKLGKEGYLQLENEAKLARIGMWEKGTKGETPAEYKRRHAQAGSVEAAEAVKPAEKSLGDKKTWWRRFFSRT